MKEWTDIELLKLAKKKLDLSKLKDKHVVLHPEISEWRDVEKPDIQMLQSLNSRGLIQPIIFRKVKKGTELLAGARRYAHCKLLGWTWDEISKDVREKVSDRDALILALEENLRRKNLTVMEEARAVNSLLRNKMSIKEVAMLMNRTPSWVSSRKNLFELPEEVRNIFEEHDLEYGYSIPIRKLGGMLEAQMALLENIVEARQPHSYGGVRTVEDAEEFVTKILKQIKDTEDLLLKYGACPVCGSKDIREGYRDGQLVCRSDGCGHEWHGETKEPWAYYELKQKAEEMGIEIIEESPGAMKVTPKAAADMIVREEKRQQEKAKAEEGGLPEKFRCKPTLLMLLEPMIAGDNIQKLVVRDENIEIQLIEGKDLHFNGLRKDYKDGINKARIDAHPVFVEPFYESGYCVVFICAH